MIMDAKLQPAVDALTGRLNAEPVEFRDQVSLVVQPDQIVPAAQTLRDEFQFDMLTFVTAVDYWPELSPRFHIVYMLYSFPYNTNLCLRVPLEGNAPHLPTLEGVYPNANWYEREVWDMFGVRFDGHSDLRRILMPADWQGHPLRKDYPLGYEEVQFTFNAEEIDRRKPYAKE